MYTRPCTVLIQGQVTDKKTNEPVIALSLYEVHNIHNVVLTDTLGHFKIKMQNDVPVVVINGYYEPLYVKVNPSGFNTIEIGEELMKKSKKIKKELNKIH